MLDRLSEELFDGDGVEPEAIMHSELAQQISSRDGRTVLSISVPFAAREDLDLKKVGDELIVRAGREKRAIVLPAALSRHSPTGARFEQGRLEITFDGDAGPGARPAEADTEAEATAKPEPEANEPEGVAAANASGEAAG